MCGVAGFHLKNPNYVRRPEGMETMVDELLREIEWRGKHATGLVAVTNRTRLSGGKLSLQKEAVPAEDFVKLRRRLPKGTRTVLLHTRHATQGSVKEPVNNHPVMFGSCFAVHNGGIDNDTELFDKYKLDRGAEVDSEAVPAMLYHFGWDKAADALETLAGGFAIAVVDPVKEPGKVLLAKGLKSPFYVVENENFIIWASTMTAIKQAWGKVLGTPPNDKSILMFKPGQGILLDGSKSTPFQFDAWKSSHDYKGTSTHYGAWGGETSYDDNKGRQRPTTTHAPRNPVERPIALPPASTPRGVVCNRLVEVAKLRREGGGVARRWDLRESGGPSYEHENLLDDTGTVRWVFCPSCRGSVCAKDMAELKGEGMVCLDCIIVHGEKEAGLDPKPFRFQTKLTPEREKELESAASSTANVHEKAMTEVVLLTGITRYVIDYLMFHTPDSMFESGSYSDLEALGSELTELYEAELLAAWEEYDWEEHNNSQYESCETKTNTGLCRLHGIPDTGDDGCYKCSGEQVTTEFEAAVARDADKPAKDRIVTVANGVPQVVEKCPDCQRFYNPDKGCKVCAEKRAQEPPAPDPEPDRICAKCIRKAVVFLNGGKLASYCSGCFNTCHKCMIEVLDGKRKPSEMSKPNHTLRNKTRVCHAHARNQEGALADAQIPKMGMEIAYKPSYSPTEQRAVHAPLMLGPTLH